MIPTAFALSLLAACGREPGAEGKTDIPEPSGPPVAQQIDARPAVTSAAAPAWESAASAEGTSLRLTQTGGKVIMSIGCLGRPARLVVTVPGFATIGSEDRINLGLGDEPVTLVADPTGQSPSAVTGEGPPPRNFEELLERAAQVSALYGTQQSGPHPAPTGALKDALVRACMGQ